MPHVVRIAGGARKHTRGVAGHGPGLSEEARPPKEVTEAQRDKMLRAGTHAEAKLENIGTAWDSPEQEPKE